MKMIRHLITIVFLLCGLTALGRERGYDRNDLVGTYKYNETKEYVLDLHLHSDNTFMVASTAAMNHSSISVTGRLRTISSSCTLTNVRQIRFKCRTIWTDTL